MDAALILARAGRRRASKAALRPDELAAEWAAVDAARARTRRRLGLRAVTLFQRAEGRTMGKAELLVELVRADAAMKASAAEVAADFLFDLSAFLEDLAEIMRPELLLALQEGFRTGALRIHLEGLAFDAERPEVRAALDAILHKVDVTAQTTRRDVARAIADGLERRETVAQMAQRVRQVFTEAKGGRAEVIAWTASTAAFERGQMLSFQDAGITHHRWLSQRDARVRGREEGAGHWEADGQEVEIGTPFRVRPTANDPYEGLLHPGDPAGSGGNVIKCRCTLLPVLREGV